MAHRRLRNALQGRGLLLLPVAAFAVHQLRYTLAYGSDAGRVMAAQGHSYVNSLGPWLVLLLALGAGSFLLCAARALERGFHDHPRRSFLGLWSISSMSLVAIYVAQELLEGLFAVGHPGGIAGVFGHGGWWALLLALAVGALLAALLRLSSTVVSRLARRPRVFGVPPLVFAPHAVSLLPRPPLALAAAGRAPPLA